MTWLGINWLSMNWLGNTSLSSDRHIIDLGGSTLLLSECVVTINVIRTQKHKTLQGLFASILLENTIYSCGVASINYNEMRYFNNNREQQIIVLDAILSLYLIFCPLTTLCMQREFFFN